MDLKFAWCNIVKNAESKSAIIYFLNFIDRGCHDRWNFQSFYLSILFTHLKMCNVSLRGPGRITAPCTITGQVHLAPAPVIKINKVICYVRNAFRFNMYYARPFWVSSVGILDHFILSLFFTHKKTCNVIVGGTGLHINNCTECYLCLWINVILIPIYITDY